MAGVTCGKHPCPSQESLQPTPAVADAQGIAARWTQQLSSGHCAHSKSMLVVADLWPRLWCVARRGYEATEHPCYFRVHRTGVQHFQAHLERPPPVNVDGQDVDELLHLLQPEGAQGHKGTDKVE
ncbi:hypothetical protein V8C86DRAFT_1832000 [Haematococcus lacustris]